MFFDRKDAGEQLAVALQKYKSEDAIILAIPRGGLPIGAVISEKLNKPLDVVLTKKIGHPHNKEYAIGAVSMHHKTISDTIDVSERYLKEETLRIRESLGRRYDQYYKNCDPLELENKTAIIVDDGIATGNTLVITIELVANKKPAKIVVAIPVAPASVLKKINDIDNVTEVVCLYAPSQFRAVGAFYQDFTAVSDKEAVSLLTRIRGRKLDSIS